MKPRLTAVEPRPTQLPTAFNAEVSSSASLGEAMKLYEDSATVRSNQLQKATPSDDAQSDNDWGVFPAQPRIWRSWCPAQPRDLAWY